MGPTQNISVIDLGTGSIRNTIYGPGGEVLSVIKKDNPILHPRPGWAEQDPVQWWRAVKETFSELDPAICAKISALSVTSQREGIVPVDAQFNPLDNIIIWLDGRTSSEGLAIEKKIPGRVFSTRGSNEHRRCKHEREKVDKQVRRPLCEHDRNLLLVEQLSMTSIRLNCDLILC